MKAAAIAREATRAPFESITPILAACFFFSGAAGLIYEVVWARQLSLFLGITGHATTAVLTAYMLGLAAGSLVIGRIADRLARPIRLYALLEAGIGLYAVTTPWLFPAMQQGYAQAAAVAGVTGPASHLLRFLLALALLLVPTFLMGGTLPLLIRGLTPSLPALARQTARLYGVNTLGATLGTFAAGYLLLPAIGVRGAILVGVLVNLGVAATALLALRGRRGVSGDPRGAPAGSGAAPAGAERLGGEAIATPIPAGLARVLLAGFAISGFSALLYEIAWIRALTLVIGSSVYAFSITLTTYLAGLAAGSLLHARFFSASAHASESARAPASESRRAGGAAPGPPPLARAAILEFAVGIASLATLPLLAQLPSLFLRGWASLHQSFALFQGFLIVLCFLVMFVPTLILGALFPLLTSLATRPRLGIGRGVGIAYAANTAGTVAGSLLGGLWLLPSIGVRGAILVAAAAQAVVALAFYLARRPAPPVLPAGQARPARPARPARTLVPVAAAAVLFVAVALLTPRWDRVLMTSGVFVNAAELAHREPGQSLREKAYERKLVYYEEGIDGVVAVEETPEERVLVINGKDDASSRTDLPTQVLLGQIPMLVHPDPRRVLVIGLGSGITVGSVATHPEARSIDVLEISPEVVEASDYFAGVHGHVLSDPRVKLIVADARNFLLAEKRRYDLITSEPSNPWISGISNLFTRDFFELARERLAPGGVMAQWLETYNMSPEDVKIVLRTFLDVFPHVSVWMPMPGDLLFLGSAGEAESPAGLDYRKVRAALQQPRVREDLARVGIESFGDLTSTFLIGGEDLERYCGDAPRNSDDRPRIEFRAPRNLYANATIANLESIVAFLGERAVAVPSLGLAACREEPARIEAPALGLVIAEPCGDAAPSQPPAQPPGQPSAPPPPPATLAQSLIRRAVRAGSDGGPPEMVVQAWRRLAWRDTEAIVMDRPALLDEDAARAELQAMLGGADEEGRVAIAGRTAPVAWMQHADEEGTLRTGLTWVRPWPDGRRSTHYLVVRTEAGHPADRRSGGEGAARRQEESVERLARALSVTGAGE